METDDQSNLPTTPCHIPGADELPPVVSPDAAAAMLGAGRSIGSGGPWQPPAPEELQRDFPLYEIRGILGKGGMGAVYQGWQKSLDRLVAIKILPPGMDDSIGGFTERFKREAKAMAQLQHPGIVTVFDAGTTSTGLLYFVMECITGTDVHQLVRERGRLDPAEALRITTAVCDALGYAHEHGIIHRDIKPSNIMLDARGVVKVADFGLAKTTGTDTTMLTMSNVTMGTPEFMAPESLKGVANVDHRVDLYAVGVMLYQMLTGEIPRGRFVPPSRAVPGLDKRLDGIVDKALQTDPAARYSTAIEVKAAIEPVTRAIAKRTVAIARAAAPRKNPPLLAIGIAIAVLAIVAALIHFAPWKMGGVPGGSTEALKLAGVNLKDDPQWRSVNFASLDPLAVKQQAKNSQLIAGVLHLKLNDAWFGPGPFLNGAVRATIRWSRATNLPQLLIRQTSTKPRYYLRALPDGSAELGIKSPAETVLKRFPGGTPRKAGDEVTLQLSCIGHRLTIWMDHRLLGSFDDSAIAYAGTGGIQAQDGEFISLEVLNLDGLPEAEALKLAGISEAPKSPTPQVSASSPTYPQPRQWIDATEAVRTAGLREGKLKVEGDGLVAPVKTGFVLADFRTFSDVAMRVTFSGCVTLKLRKDKPGGYAAHLDSYRAPTASIRLSAEVPGGDKSALLDGGPKRFTVADAGDGFHELVLAAKGRQIGMWVDGQQLASATDTRFTDGILELVFDAEPNSQPSRVKRIEYGEFDSTATPATATKDAPFVNGLGMKFVPVPITGGPTGGQRVLFSVWETRVQDYLAFADETGGSKSPAQLPQEPTHPAVRVAWNYARDFCKWLTARERKAGRLGPGEEYRLPSDHEWSCAVGIGDREDPAKTPEEKDSKIADVFPWGTTWPPPAAAGNLLGEEALAPENSAKNAALGIKGGSKEFRDGFIATAPVGSFHANPLGLHDLAGNVDEWCDGWWNGDQSIRVSRGGGWSSYVKSHLLSAVRNKHSETERAAWLGFRTVLAPAP